MSNDNSSPIKSRLYNIDFLRLMFVVMIVYYHFIPAYYVQRNNFPLLATLLANSRWIGLIGNAALFIISGYFLAFSFGKTNKSFLQFALHKLLRFWPTLCFGILIMAILKMFHLVKFSVGQNILNLFLITQNGTGLTTQLANLNATWFICALFWDSLFYFALFNVTKNRYLFNFLVAIISYFGVVLFINSNIRDYEVIHGIFPRGGSLAIGMIGFGILINAFLEEIKIEKLKINFWLASALECLLMFYLVHGCLIKKFKETYLVMILAFAVLFILFIIHQGVLSRCLNKPWVEKIGRYAFSIYIMQAVSFIPIKYVWLNFSGTTNVFYIAMILLSLCISIVIGILTYHLVEKPVADYYRKKIKY